MAVEVLMPQLGLTMTAGTISRWLKKVGDCVEKGEPLLEVMTDKANMEVESPASGVLLKVLAQEGLTVPITEIIAYIGEQGEETGDAPAPAGAGSTPAGGEEPRKQTPALTPERDKGDRNFTSPRARRAARELGVSLAGLAGSGPGGRIVERDVVARAGVQQNGAEKAGAVRLTPLAKKVAESCGIAAAELTGIKAGGRVTREDVLALHGRKTAAAEEAPAQVITTIPFSGIRKLIADKMSLSVHTAAQVTLTTEVDMTETVRMREQLLPEIEKTGGSRISYTDILVKVAARALSEFPRLNATLRGDCIELVRAINVGVAVAAENGLMVPVVHRADALSLKEICARTKDLVDRARRGKLRPDDMQGGTFTVSNLGMYEIDAFTPIINSPEAAILGVGRMVQKPVVVRGEIAVRWMMYLSLTFDHRLVDGAPAAEFLRRVKRLLENPYTLLA
ncbi:MAG: 2-oxo acid dehydrogenase subunit E2 [Eubacteriales bacterium]